MTGPPEPKKSPQAASTTRGARTLGMSEAAFAVSATEQVRLSTSRPCPVLVHPRRFAWCLVVVHQEGAK